MLNKIFIFVFLLIVFGDNGIAKTRFENIEIIALEIAKELGFSINNKTYLQKMDKLAKNIKANNAGKEKIVDTIIKHIYSIPENVDKKPTILEEEGLLNVLLDQGTGNCFSYSILFLSLGNRLGVEFQPILIPGHIYLKYKKQNIETTLNGKNLSDNNIAKLLYLDPGKIKFVQASKEQLVSSIYSNACLLAGYKKLFQGGIKFCNKAIKYNRDNGEAFINRSYINGVLGELNKSFKDAKEGVRLYPESSHAHSTMGLAYRRLGKRSEAVEAYKKSISIRPNLFRTHYNLGNIFLDIGKFNEAISSFSEAIHLKNNYTNAYKNRGIAYSLIKNHLKAIGDYTYILNTVPGDFEILFERGKAYYALKKYGLAIKDFEKMQKLFPEKSKKEEIGAIIVDLKKIRGQ